jgi:hypothetical protein
MSSQLSRSNASFSVLTRNECRYFPASFECVAGILYMEWSLARSLPAVTLVLLLDGQEVIPLAWNFSPFFNSPEKCLFRHFFFVGHYCAYSLCFATPQMVKDLWTEEPSIHVHTVTLPFYHTTCQQHRTPCCVLSWENVPLYILLSCRRSHFLPDKVHIFLSNICGAFLW